MPFSTEVNFRRRESCAEAASSISGDNIKTIVKYYADPAQPNIGATRIIDLL